MVATSLATLVNEAVRCGAIDWPVEQGVSSIHLVAQEAASACYDQDVDMTDAMVRLLTVTLTQSGKVTSRAKLKSLHPLPTPP